MERIRLQHLFHNSLSRWLMTLCLCLALTGCGGGTETDPDPTPPSLQSRTLNFTNSETAKLLVDDSYSNPATTVGGGIIEYESDDTEVAVVDSQGVVTALKPGQTAIHARIAANADFTAASASYPVNIIVPNVNITAWVGPEDTQIKLPNGLAGIDFYSSSEPNCDYDNYSGCHHGQLTTNLPDSADIKAIEALTLNAQGGLHYQVRHGEHQAGGAISTTRFSARTLHQAVYFNNQFWLIGGTDGVASNQVWSSFDGRNWFLVAPTGLESIFPARLGHQLVVFDAQDSQGERLWIIGGTVDGNGSNDVWSSTDGQSWQPITEQADFPIRSQHQVVAFDGRLWLIGGFSSALGRRLNDVWFSDDGASWQPVEDLSAAFRPRSDHQVVVFDDRLWLIDGNESLGDVWMSENGEDWTEVTDATAATFPGRTFHQVAVFNNRLWLLGGYDGNRNLNDVWSMQKTGAGTYQWQNETDTTNFADAAPNGIIYFQTLVAQGQLWLLGGAKASASNEVWSSPDGRQWSLVTNQPDFKARAFHQVVVFDDDASDAMPARLWLIGGGTPQSGLAPSDEVWSSRDGLNWTLEPAGARFSARTGHQVEVFDGRLWLVGGRDSATGLLNDVWSSPNGIDWVNETDVNPAGFDARQGHQLVTFNDQLWLIAGQGNSGTLKDVWSLSARGENWVNRSSTRPENFPVRQLHQALVFNDELLLIAGSGRNDVWFLPSNETLWQEKTGGQRFSNRGGHQVVVYDAGEGERLWLVGGDALDGGPGEVWSSVDGNEWQRVTEQAAFAAARNHQVLTYNDGSGEALWLVAGEQYRLGGLHNQVWRSRDGAVWRQGYKSRFDLQKP